MEMIDRNGEPRSDEDLIEAKDAIVKELISLKNVSSILLYYPTIIDGLKELLERRKNDRSEV